METDSLPYKQTISHWHVSNHRLGAPLPAGADSGAFVSAQVAGAGAGTVAPYTIGRS